MTGMIRMTEYFRVCLKVQVGTDWFIEITEGIPKQPALWTRIGPIPFNLLDTTYRLALGDGMFSLMGALFSVQRGIIFPTESTFKLEGTPLSEKMIAELGRKRD